MARSRDTLRHRERADDSEANFIGEQQTTEPMNEEEIPGMLEDMESSKAALYPAAFFKHLTVAVHANGVRVLGVGVRRPWVQLPCRRAVRPQQGFRVLVLTSFCSPPEFRLHLGLMLCVLCVMS